MMAVALNMARAKPIAPTRKTSVGAITMPPKVAPLNARLMASPRRRSNHALTTVAITTVPMPAQPSAMRR